VHPVGLHHTDVSRCTVNKTWNGKKKLYIYWQ